MKFALSSDTHLLLDKPVARLDDAHKTQKGKVDEILDWCSKNGASWLIAGDFLHQSRSWYLLSSWLDYFKQKKRNVNIYVVFGQHDTYLYNETISKATALGVLASAGIVNCLTSHPVMLADLHHGPIELYGCNQGESVPVPRRKNGFNILVIHRMIVDVKLWARQEKCDYAPAFLNKHRHFDLIVCGDCHRRFVFKSVDGDRIICNSGPLIRYEANEYNLRHHEPGFFVYDTNKHRIKWKRISYLPATEVLSREHIEEKEKTNEMLERFINSIKETTPEMKGKGKGIDFRENLVKFLRSNKIGKDVKEVLSEVVKDQLVK